MERNIRPGDAKTGRRSQRPRQLGEADKVEDKDDKLGNDSYDPGRVLSNLKGTSPYAMPLHTW